SLVIIDRNFHGETVGPVTHHDAAARPARKLADGAVELPAEKRPISEPILVATAPHRKAVAESRADIYVRGIAGLSDNECAEHPRVDMLLVTSRHAFHLPQTWARHAPVSGNGSEPVSNHQQSIRNSRPVDRFGRERAGYGPFPVAGRTIRSICMASAQPAISPARKIPMATNATDQVRLKAIKSELYVVCTALRSMAPKVLAVLDN